VPPAVVAPVAFGAAELPSTVGARTPLGPIAVIARTPPALFIARPLATLATLTADARCALALGFTGPPNALLGASGHPAITAGALAVGIALPALVVAVAPNVPIAAITHSMLDTAGAAWALLTGAALASTALASGEATGVIGAGAHLTPPATSLDAAANLVSALDTASRAHPTLGFAGGTASPTGTLLVLGARLGCAPTHAAHGVSHTRLLAPFEAPRIAHLAGVHLAGPHAALSRAADQPIGARLPVGIIEAAVGGAYASLHLTLAAADDGAVSAMIRAHAAAQAHPAGAHHPRRARLGAHPRRALQIHAFGEARRGGAPALTHGARASAASRSTAAVETDRPREARIGLVPRATPKGAFDTDLRPRVDAPPLAEPALVLASVDADAALARARAGRHALPHPVRGAGLRAVVRAPPLVGNASATVATVGGVIHRRSASERDEGPAQGHGSHTRNLPFLGKHFIWPFSLPSPRSARRLQ
jgi:hypothetical protein